MTADGSGPPESGPYDPDRIRERVDAAWRTNPVTADPLRKLTLREAAHHLLEVLDEDDGPWWWQPAADDLRAALATPAQPALDVERLAIEAAARLEGEVSRLRTELAACNEAYAAARLQGQPET